MIKATIRGRLQFPNFTEEDNYGKYSAVVIFPPGSESEKKAQTAIDAVVKQGLNGKKPTPENLCMKSGNGRSYDGYEGMLFISASKVKGDPPLTASQMVGRDGKPVPEETFYPGCEVNLLIDFWPQSNSYGKKVNASLVAVQFVNDGEKLAAGASADVEEGDFEDLPPLEPVEMDPDALG